MTEDLPLIFVHKVIDFETHETFEEPQLIKFDGELKLRSLRVFVNQFERDTPKQEELKMSSDKVNKKGYRTKDNFLVATLDDIKSEVYDMNEACIVYFVDADTDSASQKTSTFLLDTIGYDYLGAIQTVLIQVKGGSSELKK